MTQKISKSGGRIMAAGYVVNNPKLQNLQPMMAAIVECSVYK